MIEITLFGDPVDIPKVSYNPHVLNTGIALSKSRQEVLGCDLTLILKDHSIMLLHKSILICHSPVFAAMLTGGNCLESLQGEIQIDDFDAKVVPEIVVFFYLFWFSIKSVQFRFLILLAEFEIFFIPPNGKKLPPNKTFFVKNALKICVREHIYIS